MEANVSEDVAARKECCCHTGDELPVAEIVVAIWIKDLSGLFDNLTVDLVPQGFQVMCRLKDCL